jgi:hypothetical protein
VQIYRDQGKIEEAVRCKTLMLELVQDVSEFDYVE